MFCPRCNTPSLEERERDGITIDVCPQCRGIWLDRGELECLVARAGNDMAGDDDVKVRTRDDHGVQDHHNTLHKDHSYNGHGDGHHHKIRNWLAEIFD